MDLLARARGHLQAGQLEAAETLFRAVLAGAPDHGEAHAFLGREALRRGAVADALRHLEWAVRSSPGSVELHHQLGIAHDALGGRDDHEATLDQICGELPFAFTSLLHRARLREAGGDRVGAVTGYLRAIRTAQHLGFWFAEASTPAWLRSAVRHAMDVAHHGRIALFQDWVATLAARYGEDEMHRVRECMAIHLGLSRPRDAHPRQRPTFLYFPGLPVTPVFARDTLPFAAWYEAQFPQIRDEMRAVRETAEVQPFHHDVPEAGREELTRGGAWDAYFLFGDGQRFDAHHAACPITSSVLAELPLDRVRDHGPEVCFSIMRPGTHILPHRGVTNTRAVLHLGLEIPEHCALHLVGVEQVHWREGRCFAFDDTFEHEAWNRSEQTRVILLGDIWNPHLRPAECAALADLIAWIGDFNRATEPRA